MHVELSRSAQLDVVEAALTYELERAGLGSRFEQELDRVLERVAYNPRQFPIVEDDVHRALLRVFPFAAFFTILPDRVSVIAVLHLHRHPDTWKASR